MDGKPLSIHWETGDTFLSVTLKKFKAFFEIIFDPRNYTQKGLIELKHHNS